MPHGENKHQQKEIFLPSLPFFKSTCLYAVPERERPILLPCFCRLFSFSSSPFCLSLRRGAKEREEEDWSGWHHYLAFPGGGGGSSGSQLLLLFFLLLPNASFPFFVAMEVLLLLPLLFLAARFLPGGFFLPDDTTPPSPRSRRLKRRPTVGTETKNPTAPAFGGGRERNYLQTKLKREGKRAMYAPPGCIIIQKGRHRPRIELSLHRKEKAFSLFLSPLSAASEFRPTLSTDVPIQTSGQRIGAPSNPEQQMEKLCL